MAQWGSKLPHGSVRPVIENRALRGGLTRTGSGGRRARAAPSAQNIDRHGAGRGSMAAGTRPKGHAAMPLGLPADL